MWRLSPLNVAVLSDDGSGGGFYIVAALQVSRNGEVNHCYMDVSFPERINDYAYFVGGNQLDYGETRQYPGKIIPAIALDCFGRYDMFYVKAAPQIGVDVLTRGLALSTRKRYVAQDLGYIFRDEKRYREAAEMFELVVGEEDPSEFIFDELAQLYEKIGDVGRQAKYAALGACSHRRSRP